MKIAIDKNSVNIAKNDGNEYIYLFDNEDYRELLKIGLHCLDYRYCEFVDINLTDYNVECIKKAKPIDKDWDKVERKNYKIGIIIPNYNYEHTIEKCLESIFSQTYTNYEIIFVDDMSTDNSIDVAQATYLKYCAKELKGQDPEWTELPKNFKLVRLQQKRLNGGARNEAYLHLSDDVDYVYYVDSDDWLYDEHSLEKINNKLQTQPDVLFVGMASYKNDKLTTCFIPQYKDKYEAIQGWSGSCGKVIKKNLATRQECLYNEGTLKEDRNQHRRICIYMNDFKLLQEPVYVWNQQNTKSVTTIREKVVWGTSTIRQYADTLQLALSVKGKDKEIDRLLDNAVKKCKQEMLEGKDRQW
ncbi:MAG: glycosyltransferase family 2 protein [Clostridia bacterium]|nr:glycosyltransferase family 2 protein [Bacilli bacterium]MBR3672815.1 glycosyltransferase family 2 protein [Clostridia bacterium]